MVHPYWLTDPNARVKVCAFDAQATVTDSQSGRCDQGSLDPTCGCGPDLAYCQAVSADPAININTEDMINRSLVTQALRVFESIVRDDRPYTDLVLSDQVEINGPISHFLRFQTGTTSDMYLVDSNVGFDVPDISFSLENEWHTATGTGRFAGILTSPFYLLRYATNRARANRYYSAFLCSHFEASAQGLPPPDDPCNAEPNLTKRCGCKDCHLRVEPMAAYWGRWSERGIVPLVDAAFPEFDMECTSGSPSQRCQNYYFTYGDGDQIHPDLQPFRGTLKAFVFADDTRRMNIATGPIGLAQDSIMRGDYARCAVTKLWTRFIGRDPIPDDPEDAAAFDGMVSRFVSGGYRLRSLLTDLVQLDQYKTNLLPERP
jgi:hypothetical protein